MIDFIGHSLLVTAANVAIYDPDMEELERELEQLVIDGKIKSKLCQNPIP